MAREDLHFRLRIPEDLKDRIEKAADANERSMTAEIVSRLEWTFGPSDEAMLEIIAERDDLVAQIRRLQNTVSELSHSLRTREQDIAALYADLDERRGQASTASAQVNEVKLELAYERGRAASLENALNIFMRRLAGSEADTSGLLNKILSDIKASPPPKGNS